MKTKIRKNDMVKVIAGKDKGKNGRVLDVNRDKDRVLVEGVGMIKRHTRANPGKQIKGGIAEKESMIHISNVMMLTSGGITTRIGSKIDNSSGTPKRVRVARKTGEVLDKKQ